MVIIVPTPEEWLKHSYSRKMQKHLHKVSMMLKHCCRTQTVLTSRSGSKSRVMKIETKQNSEMKSLEIRTQYNVGEIVWTTLAIEPTQCKVEDIELWEVEGVLKVAYYVASIKDRIFGIRFSHEIFSTEEEAKKIW